MEIGVKIRQLRREKDLTQKELGKYLGVAESTVSLYEKGRNKPDLAMLRKLATFFNVSMDYLAGNQVAEEKSEYNILAVNQDDLKLLNRIKRLSPRNYKLLEAILDGMEDDD